MTFSDYRTAARLGAVDPCDIDSMPDEQFAECLPAGAPRRKAASAGTRVVAGPAPGGELTRHLSALSAAETEKVIDTAAELFASFLQGRRDQGRKRRRGGRKKEETGERPVDYPAAQDWSQSTGTRLGKGHEARGPGRLARRLLQRYGRSRAIR